MRWEARPSGFYSDGADLGVGCRNISIGLIDLQKGEQKVQSCDIPSVYINCTVELPKA